MNPKIEAQLRAREQLAMYVKRVAEEALLRADTELRAVRAELAEHQPVEVMTGVKGGA